MNSQTTRKLNVFLCYASDDKEVVKSLYNRLLSDGIEAWLDSEKLFPGQLWQLEIPKAVRAADVVLVCISKGSLDKEGYVQKQIRIALDIADEKPDGTIFLIPVHLENCTIPERLAHLQSVNLFESQGYGRLLKSLQVRASELDLGLKGDNHLITAAPNNYPETFHASFQVSPTMKTDAHLLEKELQRRLVILLRDSDLFSIDDIHMYWQDFVNPTVDWNIILRSGKSQPELAGELVGHVVRMGNLANLVVAIRESHEEIMSDFGNDLKRPPIVFDLDIHRDFVRIPAGTFWMGSQADDLLAEAAEKPQHEMKIPYAFWMARYPVTNRQFLMSLGETSKEHYSSVVEWPDHPVTNITWYEALEYCKWLTRTYGYKLEQGYVFRLPSEAEWELAARGPLPSRKKYPWGNHWSTPELSLCNSAEENLNCTKLVGNYSPHGDSYYKIADMAGNVREWTRSVWGKSIEKPDFSYPYRFEDYESVDLSDNFLRVARGGSFSDDRSKVTCAYRYRHSPLDKQNNLGFRVAISPINVGAGPRKLDHLNVDPIITKITKSLFKKK